MGELKNVKDFLLAFIVLLVCTQAPAIQTTPASELPSDFNLTKQTTECTSQYEVLYNISDKTLKVDKAQASQTKNLHPDLHVRMAAAQHLNYSKIIDDINLDDIYIAVKTTSKYSDTRLPIIVKTWFQLAMGQTWFFTDNDDELLQELTDGHMVNTGCKSTFERKALCCKTNVELDRFLRSEKKWLCLFEDDNYVNVPRLVEVLQAYNHLQDWYLGKNSIREPIRLTLTKFPGKRKVRISFWYAVGSGGVCISKHLAIKLAPLTRDGKFTSQCEGILSPPDVTLGFMIEHLLKKKLTIVPQFHSHVEQMKMFDVDIIMDQVSFSYSQITFNNETWWNVVDVPVVIKNDTTRFLSLHCFLYPKTSYCHLQ